MAPSNHAGRARPAKARTSVASADSGGPVVGRRASDLLFFWVVRLPLFLGRRPRDTGDIPGKLARPGPRVRGGPRHRHLLRNPYASSVPGLRWSTTARSRPTPMQAMAPPSPGPRSAWRRAAHRPSGSTSQAKSSTRSSSVCGCRQTALPRRDTAGNAATLAGRASSAMRAVRPARCRATPTPLLCPGSASSRRISGAGVRSDEVFWSPVGCDPRVALARSAQAMAVMSPSSK